MELKKKREKKQKQTKKRGGEKRKRRRESSFFFHHWSSLCPSLSLSLFLRRRSRRAADRGRGSLCRGLSRRGRGLFVLFYVVSEEKKKKERVRKEERKKRKGGKGKKKGRRKKAVCSFAPMKKKIEKKTVTKPLRHPHVRARTFFEGVESPSEYFAAVTRALFYRFMTRGGGLE